MAHIIEAAIGAAVAVLLRRVLMPKSWSPGKEDLRSCSTQAKTELAVRNLENVKAYYTKPEAQKHLAAWAERSAINC